MYVLHSLDEQNPNAESPRYRPAAFGDGVDTILPELSVNVSRAIEADVLLIKDV